MMAKYQAFGTNIAFLFGTDYKLREKL